MSTTAVIFWLLALRAAQRCTGCHRDTPYGSPAKCGRCRSGDLQFGYVESNINFCGGRREVACGVDEDPDAWARAADQD